MKKTLVFDSSTLILLAKSTLLGSFANINNILITKKIVMEVLEKEEADDAKMIKRFIQEGLINEEVVANTNLANDFVLGGGEAEALSLALHRRIVLATDDLRAIKACKVLGIKFMNAIHCLIILYNSKILDKRLALEKLKNLEKYGRYSTYIIKDARRIIEGGKNG